MVRGSRGREPGLFFEQARTLRDPYLPKKAIPEPARCPRCQAIYYRQHWSIDPKLSQRFRRERIKLHDVTCPACHKIADHYPMGVVQLSGKFCIDHEDELVHLVQGEERRAREKNPLERLMKIQKQNGGIQVETTTDRLALRIGRILRRAYKGALTFHFRPGDKYVTVNWRREG